MKNGFFKGWKFLVNLEFYLGKNKHIQIWKIKKKKLKIETKLNCKFKKNWKCETIWKFGRKIFEHFYIWNFENLQLSLTNLKELTISKIFQLCNNCKINIWNIKKKFSGKLIFFNWEFANRKKYLKIWALKMKKFEVI